MNTDACSAWLVGGTLAATSGIHVMQEPGRYGGAPDGAWTHPVTSRPPPSACCAIKNASS